VFPLEVSLSGILRKQCRTFHLSAVSIGGAQFPSEPLAKLRKLCQFTWFLIFRGAALWAMTFHPRSSARVSMLGTKPQSKGHVNSLNSPAVRRAITGSSDGTSAIDVRTVVLDLPQLIWSARSVVHRRTLTRLRVLEKKYVQVFL
jgi:hypothetical protein